MKALLVYPLFPRSCWGQEYNNALTGRFAEGALSDHFERMLVLTATPFQLGHYELMHVLASGASCYYPRLTPLHVRSRLLFHQHPFRLLPWGIGRWYAAHF